MYTDYKPKHEKQMNGILIRSAQGKHIGDVIGREWRKEIRNSHMLTTPPAIANDVQALHDAVRAGAEYVVITNTDTGIIYRAAIAKIFDKGFEVNRGFGLQRALPLSAWLQSPDPGFIQTVTPAYSEPTATAEIKELKFTSHAPTGSTFNGVKQLNLFTERKTW